MTWPTALLDEAERLVKKLVALDPSPRPDDPLATRQQEVIERLTELLRFRASRLESELSMGDLLGRGIVLFAGGPA